MRTPFVMTFLATAVALSGCAEHRVVELGTVPSQSAYDDRLLDSLGGQRNTEQQMLHLRKVQQLELHLQELEEKRRALESALGVSQLEAGKGRVSASQDEAARMTEFAAASHASQVRIAQETANHAVEQSLIENERDRKLMQAEIEANRKLAELDRTYSISIRNAKSDAERIRLKSDLEAEQMKAEAQRQKALIEADAARELSQAEQRIHQQINSRKQTDSKGRASSAAANQLLEKQRITVALANADAERRVKGEIAKSQQTLQDYRKEMAESLGQYKAEIAQLEQQIRQIEGKMAAAGAAFESRIAIEETRLADLKLDSERLAEVGLTLIESPLATAVTPQGLSPDAEAEVQRLESELITVRGDVNARRTSRIADVEQKLASDLSQLSYRVSLELASAAGSGNVLAETERLVKAQAITDRLAIDKTEITNDARTELAKLDVKTEIAKAGVVAPVVTGRAVYSGDYGQTPEIFAVKERPRNQAIASGPSYIRKSEPNQPVESRPVESKKREPALVVSTFGPNHSKPARQVVHDVIVTGGTVAGGGVRPLVITPAVTTYSVVYRYKDKGSADKYAAFLRAYGVNDFTYSYSAKLDEHVLFMGRYSSAEQAASRVTFLNRTTSTSHAQVVESDS